MPFVASLAGIVRSRVEHAARRAGLRAALIALAVLLALAAAGFALAAAVVAMAREFGVVPALLIMAGLALLGVLIALLALSIEAQREKRIAMRRSSLDSQFAAAAMSSAAASRLARRPSRGAIGLILVALGAFLVLRGRD